jgi:hypothetical protein
VSRVKALTHAEALRRIKTQGPCLVCGVPGAFAAHRWLDSTLGMVAAGDSIESVADDHGFTPAELATFWRAYVDLLGAAS